MKFANILHGMGSILDIMPAGPNPVSAYYNRINQGSDFSALRRDWELVGRDLQFGIDSFSKLGKETENVKRKP